MSTLVIISWIFVAIFTAINIFIFLKLKNASDQMMKMMFPGAKNMNEALASMQKMMQGFGSGGGPFAGKNMDVQLRSAMEMLQKAQKNPKR
ncbi:MAG: hypothetical protein AABZ06_00665 [Bdellovibrionota bacterium]